MNERPPEEGLPASRGQARQAESYSGVGQWAKIPEWVAYKDLDATAWNVWVVLLASKAGHERVAWISNRTIADRLTAEGSPIRRRGVGKAIHRLVKVGVLEEAGKVVVDREAGTWVKRYRIVDRCPDLPEGPLVGPTGQASDQPEGPSGGAIGCRVRADPMVLEADPMVLWGHPMVLQRRTLSSSVFSPSYISRCAIWN